MIVQVSTATGKKLFAQIGFEQTSTAAIAREAGTSESQLIRYFSSKRGLLAAIFDEGWRSLNQRVANTATKTNDPIAAIKALLAAVTFTFEDDRELACIFLFEGRRIRTPGPGLDLSRGYLEFVELLEGLIRRAQKVGSIARQIDAVALCSALIGAAEGMFRDRLISGRSGNRHTFSQQEVHKVFAALLAGVGPQHATRLRSTYARGGTRPKPKL